MLCETSHCKMPSLKTGCVSEGCNHPKDAMQPQPALTCFMQSRQGLKDTPSLRRHTSSISWNPSLHYPLCTNVLISRKGSRAMNGSGFHQLWSNAQIVGQSKCCRWDDSVKLYTQLVPGYRAPSACSQGDHSHCTSNSTQQQSALWLTPT